MIMDFFERLSAKTKLLFGFLLMTVLSVIVGYVGLNNASKLNDSITTMYRRDFLGLAEVREANIHMFIIARSVREAILDKKADAINEARGKIETSYQTLQRSLQSALPKMSTAEGRRNTELAQAEMEKYMVGIRQSVALSLEGKKDEAFNVLSAYQQHAWTADQLFTDVCNRKERVGSNTATQADALFRKSRSIAFTINAATTVLGVLLGLFFASWFGRALTETAQVAKTISNASQELASATENIASGAQEQAASIEETAATLEELTSTVKQNADSARQAAQLAKASRDAATKGGHVVNETVFSMKEVNESSRKIADITATIDGIAFQTNILAINAAVEAARAGEQGRGFAVVASEVRSLAERSATAAKEIKALIDDSASKIKSSYQLVETSGTALTEILNSVKRVTDFVGEIAAASAEQSTGILQVNQAVTQMDHVTQANASQTEELSGTAESLAGQADHLQTIIEKFHLADATQTYETNRPRERRARSFAPPAVARANTRILRRGSVTSREGSDTVLTSSTPIASAEYDDESTATTNATHNQDFEEI
jgi:methyl-accepting chemotaxis protein